MNGVHTRIVAAMLRLYPRAFRERFGDELLAAYLDQRDAIVASGPAFRCRLRRHFALTVSGMFRSLVAVHLHEHRRRLTLRLEHRPVRSTPMRNLVNDARHTLRLLRKQPAFAAVAVLTLALGIGANTAVFSVLNTVILSPLPYGDPGQLVRLYTAYERNPGAREYLTGLDVLDVRDEVEAFSSVGINYTYRELGGDLSTPDGQPRRIRLMPVNAEYFLTLRATPLIGRTFTRDEEGSGIRRIILSHRLWTSLTGRDPNVVGRSFEIDGESYEVIGVMRPTFLDVVTGEVDAWTPANLERRGSNNRYNHYLSAIARMQSGVSVSQAQAQVDALMRRLGNEFPNTNEERRMRVLPLRDDVVGESAAGVFVLMGAAGLVLLIACLNVANLFITRAIAQSRDIAIRTALGAGRARLVGQHLTESLVVAAAGGILGSAVAFWGVRVLLAVSPESLPRAEEVGFNVWLLMFALGVTVVTGLLFGAWPAVRASLVDPSDALHEGARGNTLGRGSRQARSFLVATQVSLALMLLVGAGILIRAFAARQQVDLGFASAGVSTFEVHLPRVRYGEPQARVSFHDAYQGRLRALPGVEQVGLTSWLPANGLYHIWGYEYRDAVGERQSTSSQVRVIDGDYFQALRIPLLRGRTFAATDGPAANAVGLISQSLARQAYGDRDPIGQQFRTSGTDFTVIGVVGDVAHDATGARGKMVYLSHDQFADNRHWALTYVVRSRGAPEQVIEPARRELAAIDPALVLYQPRAMDAVLSRHHARARFLLMLMATFAAVAVSLAAVGVYGVLSYAVTQRTHEIGVRMALGARPAQVRSIVVRQGLAVGVIGMGVGLAGAFALSRVLESFAFGVSTRDPFVFGGVTIVLAAVILVAGYLPARRATRVDPLESLRTG